MRGGHRKGRGDSRNVRQRICSRNSESASSEGVGVPVKEGSYLTCFATIAVLHDSSFSYELLLVHMLTNMCKLLFASILLK